MEVTGGAAAGGAHRGQLAAGLFHSTLTDNIFAVYEGPIGQYQNLGEITFKGIEIERLDDDEHLAERVVTPKASQHGRHGIRYVDQFRSFLEIPWPHVLLHRRMLSTAELVAEYSTARVAVVPSFFEGFGFPASEAMACGLPVVASAFAGIPELVEHEHSGLLVETDATSILYDCGATFTAVHNADEMGIDLSGVDRIVLSHGHFDHMADAEPYIREAQYKTFLDFYTAGDKNIGIVSTYDLRRRWYHPQLKIPAGERAARVGGGRQRDRRPFGVSLVAVRATVNARRYAGDSTGPVTRQRDVYVEVRRLRKAHGGPVIAIGGVAQERSFEVQVKIAASATTPIGTSRPTPSMRRPRPDAGSRSRPPAIAASFRGTATASSTPPASVGSCTRPRSSSTTRATCTGRG